VNPTRLLAVRFHQCPSWTFSEGGRMVLRNVFNEQWYLQQNPDVAEAVQQGLISAETHFNLFGKHEGRAPGPFFDPEFYLKQNPDVAAAVEAGLITAYDHFEQFGVSEARNPVP